jgi:hypothetical protein
MYVRTWKDTEMVATSDSDPTGSAANDEPDAAPPTDTTPSSDGTEPPDTASAAPAREPARSTQPGSTQTRSEPTSRDGARRGRPSVSRDQVMSAVNGVRERLAALVWIVAVVFAVILAAGALLIALEANRSNDLVEHVLDWAGGLDGPFRDLFTFDGDNAIKKAALVNWGLAAVAWLIGGRIVSAIIRP